MTNNDQLTVDDLERSRPRQAAVRAEATTPSRISSWPALLRLIADILEEGIPLLEKGGKANVFQLLMLFGRVQTAWAAFKELRKPASPPAE